MSLLPSVVTVGMMQVLEESGEAMQMARRREKMATRLMMLREAMMMAVAVEDTVYDIPELDEDQ